MDSSSQPWGHAAVGLWRHPQSQAPRYKELEYWLETADIEGFNISDPRPLLSYREFAELVTPELQKRGRSWREYDGTTFRENLLGTAQEGPPPKYKRQSPTRE
jgi:hypothetical protein